MLGQQIAATVNRSRPALFSSPGGDGGVIAAEQNIGDGVAFEFTGPGVLGELEHPISSAERIIQAALFIAEHAGQQPDDSVNDGHRGHFASVEDKVANADLFGLEDVQHALIKSFVATTHQHDTVAGGEVFGQPLVEPSTLRGQQNLSSRDIGHGVHVPNTSHGRFDLQQHSGAAAERTVIDFAMRGVFGPISEVVSLNLNQTSNNRLVQQALGQITVKDRREQGDNVESHSVVASAAGASSVEASAAGSSAGASSAGASATGAALGAGASGGGV